jgi:hypothetical protein
MRFLAFLGGTSLFSYALPSGRFSFVFLVIFAFRPI